MTLSTEDMKNWWNAAAKAGSFSAVLSGNENWDPEAFFQTGREWVEDHARFAETSQGFVHPVRLRGAKALDFGCGVGRMTRAWSERYNEVVGVDISEEMIAQATQLNTSESVSFLIQSAPPFDLPAASFDLVYSTIVLQHIPMPHSLGYVLEFFRLLKPEGYALFDAPAEELSYTLKPSDGLFIFPMTIVMGAALHAGCRLMATRVTNGRLMHYQYLFQKLPAAPVEG